MLIAILATQNDLSILLNITPITPILCLNLEIPRLCQELAQVGPIQPYMGLISHHGHPHGYKYPTITGVAPQ